MTRASAKYGTRQYVARRAKRLLTPYIALSLIGLAPKVIFAEVLNDPLTLDAQSVVEAFLVPRLNVWGHFWFLPAIFFIGLIGFGVDRLLSRTVRRNAVLSVIVILSAALTFLPPLTQWFAVDDVKEFLFFYLLGMLSAVIRPTIESLRSGAGAATGLAAVAVFLVGGALVGVLVAVLMITSVVAFSVAAGNRVRIPRDALLAQSYSIFILSWPFQLIAEIITEKILGLDFIFVMVAMFSAGMFLPMVTIRLIDAFERVTNTRFLSLAIGR